MHKKMPSDGWGTPAGTPTVDLENRPRDARPDIGAFAFGQSATDLLPPPSPPTERARMKTPQAAAPTGPPTQAPVATGPPAPAGGLLHPNPPVTPLRLVFIHPSTGYDRGPPDQDGNDANSGGHHTAIGHRYTGFLTPHRDTTSGLSPPPLTFAHPAPWRREWHRPFQTLF